MLEPLIVLTMLNCVFMFSSTVTTCALWWQYHNHRCCAGRHAARRRSDALKRPKSDDAYRTRAKRPEGSRHDVQQFVGRSSGHGDDRCRRKSSKHLAEYRKRGEERTPYAPSTRRLVERTRTSEAPRTTANDARPTVVMEFSTVQKVVQLVDNDADGDVNPMRAPFKDVVVFRDTADERHDRDAERDRAATAENF